MCKKFTYKTLNVDKFKTKSILERFFYNGTKVILISLIYIYFEISFFDSP
jgi:hypothetical protein